MMKVLLLQMSHANHHQMTLSQMVLDNRIEVCLGSFSGEVGGLGLEKSRPECERHLPGKHSKVYTYEYQKPLNIAPIKDYQKQFTFENVTDAMSLDSVTNRVKKNTNANTLRT